jgi:hypothetical protein
MGRRSQDDHLAKKPQQRVLRTIMGENGALVHE